MNIDINVKNNTIAFGDIPIGEIFIANDTIYMRTNYLTIDTKEEIGIISGRINAVNIETGEQVYFGGASKVKWLKHAKLTME